MVGNNVTPVTHLGQALIGLSTQLAEIVDKTVFSAPHIFLEFATVASMHLPVRGIRIRQHAIDNAPDSFVAWRIVRFDLL